MKRRDNVHEDLDNKLYNAILLLKTPQECKDFFTDLCTPAELEALGDRWEVAQLLAGNMPYRAISEKTGVSVTTVTRVARSLFHGNNGYKTILERLGVL